MRARTWTMTLGVGALAVGLLGGCGTPKDGRTYPTSADVTRAQRVWADPWVAPDTATTVEPRGSAPAVRREAGGRAYLTSAHPRVAVATEVRAAISVGWQLVGAQCQPDEQGLAGSVTAQLSRGTTPDDGRLATVQASLTLPDAAQSRQTQVGLAASVAHHLDLNWPAPTPVDVESSCLVAAPDGPVASSPSASATPLSGPVALTGQRITPPSWTGDPVPDDLRDALLSLRGDPSLAALGLTVAEPADTGDSEPRRAAMSARAPLRTGDGLTETVTSLMAQGWTLTYAGCIGAGAPNLAEVSRSVGERTAVLRLSEVRSMVGGAPVDATLVVSTPGYSPDVPSAISDPCFAAATAPTTFAHKGVPHLGPTRMVPLQR